jgi:Rrf2 family nitric oxide-sensitive transcriptional repressor
MRMTVHTDYALRLLLYLAMKKGRPATVAEVAATFDISENYLTKVAHELGVAGYVVSVRGRSGAYRLAKPVEAIKLGEVVRKTEPDMTLVPCASRGDTSSAPIPAWFLQRAVALASAAFLNVLDHYTLGDLIEQGTNIFQGLG